MNRVKSRRGFIRMRVDSQHMRTNHKFEPKEEPAIAIRQRANTSARPGIHRTPYRTSNVRCSAASARSNGLICRSVRHPTHPVADSVPESHIGIFPTFRHRSIGFSDVDAASPGPRGTRRGGVGSAISNSHSYGLIPLFRETVIQVSGSTSSRKGFG